MEEQVEPRDKQIPLAVDLDGTLCRTDTLHEALLALARENPLALLQLPGWLAGGKAALKAQLVEKKVLRAKDLPLNNEVVDLVKSAKSEGRTTVLVSAANEAQVRAIAEDSGLFDDFVGSTAKHNLKGRAKADYLVERFGDKGFDYVGDSKPDLDVWANARTAITVNAGTNVRNAAEKIGTEVRHLDTPNSVSAFWRAIRPHQWLKNLLVFMPVIAAHDFSGFPMAMIAFVAFSLVASSAYLINDLLDLAADRDHPSKRARPLASGRLSLAAGFFAAIAMLLAGLAVSIVSGNLGLLGVVAVYFTSTLLYSFWLKRKLIIDILTLAGLYTLRIIGGGAATLTVISPWMLAFSIFLFLCLAAIKRQAEIVNIEPATTLSGRAYGPNDLPIIQGIAISAAHASVLIFALYINSDDVQGLYSQPEFLWFVCPILLYWSLRMVMKTHRSEMTDDPIIFAARDKIGLFLVGLSVLMVVLATR